MKKIFLALALVLGAFACGPDSSTSEPPSDSPSEGIEARGEEVVSVNARTFGSLPFSAAIHGVGGTRSLFFAIVPEPTATTSSGVFVSSRATGDFLGALASPPGGYRVPLSIKVRAEGPLGRAGVAFVLDNRATPGEIGLPGQLPPTLYKIAFAYNANDELVSTILDSLELPINTSTGVPNGFTYPGSIALLPPTQGLVVTDNFGGLWHVDGRFTEVIPFSATTTVRLTLLDRRFVGRPSGPVSGVGRVGPGTGTIQPYTLLTPLPVPPGVPMPPGIGLYPGMHSAAYHADTDSLCFAVTVPGGIYCVRRTDVLDAVTPPFAKTADNPALPEDFSPGAFGVVRQVVSPPPADPNGWLMDGFDTDGEGLDDNGYYMPAPTNRLFQVHLSDASCAVTGPCPKTEIVHGKGGTVFNWTNEISVLPRLVPGLVRATTINVSQGQEYCNPAVNRLLGGVACYYGPASYALITLPY